MTAGGITNLPRSTRRYSFALTPLADAMFQLLIFFMLTSSLTSYSLLTIQSGPAAGTQRIPNTDTANYDRPAALPSVIWLIENRGVKANGQYFGFGQISKLAEALILTGTTQVVLVPTPSAQVQDMVFVLEKLAAAGINGIQIARRTNK